MPQQLVRRLTGQTVLSRKETVNNVLLKRTGGFHGCSAIQNLPPQCGRPRFDRWVGKIPWRKPWQHIPVFLPGEPPRTEEPGGLQSMGSLRVRHGRATKTHIERTSTRPYCKPYKMPFLPGSTKSPGPGPDPRRRLAPEGPWKRAAAIPPQASGGAIQVRSDGNGALFSFCACAARNSHFRPYTRTV